MSFSQGISIKNRLLAAQSVPASIVPVTIQNSATDQFSFSLGAGKTILIRAEIPFTVAATGGFRFLLHCSSAPTDYEATFNVFDGTNAGAPLTSVITAEAAFANAFALAGNSNLRMSASILANAATTVALQFACNSAANAITIIKGAFIEGILIN